MEAIEFKSKIKNGIIRIPEKYKQKTGNTVKVIIISEKVTRQRGICAALKLFEFKGNLAVSKLNYPKDEWVGIVKSST